MTELYRRMVKDMQLRGFSERTQETYLREVRKLCEHVDKSPGKISEEELREYSLHLKNEHAFSASCMKVAYCGVKFFFTFTLKREWSTLALGSVRQLEWRDQPGCIRSERNPSRGLERARLFQDTLSVTAWCAPAKRSGSLSSLPRFLTTECCW